MPGCNPSAALWAAAGKAWQYASSSLGDNDIMGRRQ
jgi:hypothetical protein